MHSRRTRVPSAILEPGTRRVYPGRVGAPNCGARDEPGMTGQRLQVRAGHMLERPHITRCAPFDSRGSCKCAKRSARTSPPKSEAERAQERWILPTFDSRFRGKAADRLSNAAPLLEWLPAPPAAAAHALPAAASAAATRGSARSSAAAAAFPYLCAESSGVAPSCSRGEGRGAGRHASKRAAVRPSHGS